MKDKIGIHLWGHQIERYKVSLWKNAESWLSGALFGFIAGVILTIIIIEKVR